MTLRHLLSSSPHGEGTRRLCSPPSSVAQGGGNNKRHIQLLKLPPLQSRCRSQLQHADQGCRRLRHPSNVAIVSNAHRFLLHALHIGAPLPDLPSTSAPPRLLLHSLVVGTVRCVTCHRRPLRPLCLTIYLHGLLQIRISSSPLLGQVTTHICHILIVS
jgi:hypothetical protein